MTLPEYGHAGVYIIRNLLDGKRYVGSTVDLRARLQKHFLHLQRGTHDNSHLQRAYNRDGEAAFECEVIEYVENATIPSLRAREQHYLDTMRPEYNIHTDASRGCRGYKPSQEAIERARSYWKGRPKSAEQRAKIAATLKGRKLAPHVAKMLLDYRTGRPRSEETKARISAAHKGVPLSEKHVQGIRKAAKTCKRKERTPEEWAQIGRNISAAKRAKMTPETRARMSAASRAKATPEFKAKISATKRANFARKQQERLEQQGAEEKPLWD